MKENSKLKRIIDFLFSDYTIITRNPWDEDDDIDDHGCDIIVF